MSAININVLTLQIQNPDSTHGQRPQYNELPGGGLTFQQQFASPLVTLSANSAPTDDDISGLLYFPSLSAEQLQSCPEANDTSIVPRNVTLQSDLPAGFNLIALAPWIPQNTNCTTAFLNAAENTMIVYQPDNSSSVPRADDDSWSLDGGEWKKRFNFPVYAVPGSVGALWIQQLSLYNGNATAVPSGHNLLSSGLVQTTDYVRLMADISTGGGAGLPSLWVFLLMVVAILIIIVAMTSCVMHCVARRRRRVLRRRVLRGEVDLEALGIKRLRVPQEVLDKMPKYEYSAHVASAAQTPAAEKSDPITVARPSPTVSSTAKGANAATAAVPTSLFHQQTCAICLDDFLSAAAIAARQSGEPRSSTSIEESKAGADARVSEASEDAAKSDTRSIRSTASQSTPSMVRELPCGHIFHAACVDPFLTTHSSLCPLCKKSSLPTGFVPRNITNNMVRRERQARSLRSRGVRVSGDGQEPHTFMAPVQRMITSTTAFAGLRSGNRHFARSRTPVAVQENELQNMDERSSTVTPGTPAPAVASVSPDRTAASSPAVHGGVAASASPPSNTMVPANNEILVEAREAAQEAAPQRRRPPWFKGMVRNLFPVA